MGSRSDSSARRPAVVMLVACLMAAGVGGAGLVAWRWTAGAGRADPAGGAAAEPIPGSGAGDRSPGQEIAGSRAIPGAPEEAPPSLSGRESADGGKAAGDRRAGPLADSPDLAAALEEARRAYEARRNDLMASDPQAAHYFRHADRLERLAEENTPAANAGLRRYLRSGPPAEQARRQAFFEHLQDMVLVPEIFEIGSNPDTEALFRHAYENNVLPERIILQQEYFDAVDALIGFVADPDEVPGDIRNSGDLFVWEFGRRVEAAEAYVASQVGMEGAPLVVEEAARDLVRAELLAKIAESYAARSEYAELMKLARTIETLESAVRSD